MPSQTMIAARRDAERREGKPPVEAAPGGYRPADTAPMNGSVIQVPGGAIMRWLPYGKNSEQSIAGIEGRWQVWRSGGKFWTNAVKAPAAWRGYSFPPKTSLTSHERSDAHR